MGIINSEIQSDTKLIIAARTAAAARVHTGVVPVAAPVVQAVPPVVVPAVETKKEEPKGNDSDKPEPAKEEPKEKQEEKPKDKSRPVSSTPVPGTPWCVVWTGDGRVFFFNPSTRTSVWEKPDELKNKPEVDKLMSSKPDLLNGNFFSSIALIL